MITDKLTKANNGVWALPAELTDSKAIGETSAGISVATGWPVDADDGPVHLKLFKVDNENELIEGSASDWKGTLAGTTLSNLEKTGGPDVDYAAGDSCVIYPTAGFWNDIFSALTTTLNRDGTLKNSIVDTDNIKDGAATAKKLDTNAIGHGFIIIARSQPLTAATDTITIPDIPDYTYLQIIVNTMGIGGTNVPNVRFNNDAAANYAVRFSVNGGAESASPSTTSIPAAASGTDSKVTRIIDVTNVASIEKNCFVREFSSATTGGAWLPARMEMSGKWANATTRITRVDVFNGGTGDFGVGSEVIILGMK